MDKVKLNVYQIEGPQSNDLRKVVESLERKSESPLRLTVSSMGRGNYEVALCQESTTVRSDSVRVVGNQIWTEKFRDLTRSALEKAKIGYKLGIVLVDPLKSKERTTECPLEGYVEHHYTPCDPLEA